ncbi:MAG TPA: hypothetical protein VGI66_15130 [Streptosporangiaceae bacterium]|jgi:hypothetical protein
MTSVEQVRGNSLVADAPGLQGYGTDAEAIFEQARRRRKRRQRASAAATGVALLAGAGIWLFVGGGGGTGAVRGGDNDRPAATTAQSRSDVLAQPAVHLAWIDFIGALNIGDPATGVQHVGPVIDASPTAPLVVAGGRLYWADARRYTPIREYDLATGKITHLAVGEAVFTSADGWHVYIIRDDTTLLALPADGSGRAAVLRVPAGWYLSGHVYQWFPWEGPVAGGIIVYSSKDAERSPGSVSEGIWNPANGQVRILGRGHLIEAVYTPPDARYSLIVWEPPGLGIPPNYSLRITNTATMATFTVRSPLRHGFVFSGTPAFSPGGRQMAVFVRTAPLGSANGMSKLAIVNTRTGAVRVVPGTALDTTEDAYWAMWLPGGQQVLAGAVGSSYVVDTRTLTARPFSFFPSTDGFSATVLP